MDQAESQRNLFSATSLRCKQNDNTQDISISRDLLEQWQKRIASHQSKLFNGESISHQQRTLFSTIENDSIDNFQPLNLIPLPINFWRWPQSPHRGPAIYIVMDRPNCIDHPLLLYVGETKEANQRWKGEHDCKKYLDSYSEALSTAEINSQLSIRFWTDVPSSTKLRRQLEQKLIQAWLPPFNKETRARWNTPFTSHIN